MNYQPLYEALRKRLLIKLTDDNSPAIIDVYNGQFEEGVEKYDAIPMPGILIDIEPGDVKSLGNRKQAQNVFVWVYIVQPQIQSLDSNQEQETRDLGFDHMKYVELVHAALHGYTDNGRIGSLSRTDVSPGFKDRNECIVHAMRYRTRYTDMSAAPEYIDMDPDPTQIILP